MASVNAWFQASERRDLARVCDELHALLRHAADAAHTDARTDAEFLGRIYESPDDEQLRRVYADWLVDRGDPRGEFIQGQCALANRISPDRREELAARRNALPQFIGVALKVASRSKTTEAKHGHATRRLFARPSGEPLSATGTSGPRPLVVILAAG